MGHCPHHSWRPHQHRRIHHHHRQCRRCCRCRHCRCRCPRSGLMGMRPRCPKFRRHRRHRRTDSRCRRRRDRHPGLQSASVISVPLPSLPLPTTLGSTRGRWTMRWCRYRSGYWKRRSRGNSRCPVCPPCRPCTR